MSDQRKTRAKQLIGGVVGSLGLAIGLWAVPAIAGASDADDDRALSVSISVPLSEIQDGQFCQAYGLASGGIKPYKFTWSGQFSGPGQHGPLGEGQIINGYVSEAGDKWLKVVVEDSSYPYRQVGSDSVSLQIGDYDYNPSCEA